MAVLASLAIGRYPVSIADAAGILLTAPFSEKPMSTAAVVVELVRLPRVLLSMLCGMGLAMAGAAMQGVFRNPLVAPEIAGVSSGAALGGALAIVLSFDEYGTVACAFGIGLAALAGTFGLAMLSGRPGNMGLLLSGVIVGTFCSALLGLVLYIANPQRELPAITYWLLGSFAGASYRKVAIVGTVLLFAGTLLLGLRWRINLMSLGEMDARSLGVKVARLRWIIVTLVALIVAAQVSVSGGVGWIGLVIPHGARLLVGPDNRRLLPSAAALGGIYLLLMDDIARSVSQQEMPIGLLTAAVGAPVFGVLFSRLGNRGWLRD